jgi:hypothetical protein
MKNKALFGRENARFIPVLRGRIAVTSEYFTGAVGRYSSAFFTRSWRR